MEWVGRVCEEREGKAKYGVHLQFCNSGRESPSMYSNIDIVFHPHATNTREGKSSAFYLKQ